MRRKYLNFSLILFLISIYVVLSYNEIFLLFAPIEYHTVNVTEVWLMNSGIMVWGYWDNSTVEDCEGLFQNGFMPHDAGKVFKIWFKEYPDPDIRCLKLTKKIQIFDITGEM